MELVFDKQSIVALASASGIGALAVVRVSGPQSPLILQKCFSKSIVSPESHRAYAGFWKDPVSGELVDEVVVLYFAEGRGFTGEASLEIMCHGGPKIVERVVECCRKAGARLAKPGEFTFRAVMNGKLDLIQAESILDVIEAKTRRAAQEGLKNLRGALSAELLKIESEVVFLLANLEASIDFTGEDIQPVSNQEMAKKALATLEKVKSILATYETGKLIRAGIMVAIVGRPNAGKSSLLNALAGEDKAIVTEFAGTTRDLVEFEKVFKGQLLRFVDTAGLRETEDYVEKLGISKTRQAMEEADLVLYLVASDAGITKEDLEALAKLPKDRLVLVQSKADLMADQNALTKTIEGYEALIFSAKTGLGLEKLQERVLLAAPRMEGEEARAILSNERQKEALEKTEQKLVSAIQALMSEASPDIVSLDLYEAKRAIEDVLGKTVREDVMDRVFREFCIGK